MAVLNYDIPVSNMEIIRDSIAVIIKTELDNQAIRQANPNLTGKVFIERFTPINKSEGTCLIVFVDRGSYTQQTQVTERGQFQFNIDIFTWDVETPSTEGYYLSAQKLQRIANLILNIIQAPQFNKLGLDPGIVYNRTVTGMQFDQPVNNADTNYSRMGRVMLTVDFHNEQPFESPITAEGYDTHARLGETDDGFKYVKNN